MKGEAVGRPTVREEPLVRSGPIADLSYRNYDGPLESPRLRWWVIAKTMVRMAFKKKSLWWVMVASGWYYVAMVFVLYVMDQIAQRMRERGASGGGAMDFLSRIVWKDQFLHGFSFGQMGFLVIALLIGAGSIANDNRANALLVYLSKPCTKLDYLLGKWVGTFIPLVTVMSVPSLVFWLYSALSYTQQGFFYQDPWVLPKLLVAFPLMAAFHSSLIVGFSSLFNQGRIAGAAYAGLYFLSNFFTQLMVFAWVQMTHSRGDLENAPQAVRRAVSLLYYASVDGVNIGLGKAVLGTNGGAYFGIPSELQPVPAPPLGLLLGVIFGLSAVSLLIAWRRIRAVEVVG